MKGILLVDKAPGMTSHDVVDHIRKAAGTRRVGHTGTLDPAATGLLIICVGEATRLSEHLTGLGKVYEGHMRLGVVTESYDMDGAIVEERPTPELSSDAIRDVFARYTGEIDQIPPMVSAVKVGGERLYKRARKGETVDRPARRVTVSEFALLDYELPLIHFRVRCTSGTYVRSLCHDAGQDFGCGAALNSLRRTAVGRHSVEDATPVADFKTLEDVETRLLPLGEALDLPSVVVRAGARGLLSRGGSLTGRDIKGECPVDQGWIQLKSSDGDLLALAQIQTGPGHALIVPRRVFMKAS